MPTDLVEGGRASSYVKGALVVLCGLTSGGCELIGYGVLSRHADASHLEADAGPLEQDADIQPADADIDATVPQADRDASSDADTGSRQRDASADSGARDGSTVDGADAAADSGAPCVVNACGGCSALVSAPDAGCGSCGLGRYECAGSDTLMCNGASALPMSAGGSVMIDNFEDGDGIPLLSSGIKGHWFSFSDGTGGTLSPPDGTTITPVFDGASGTARSAHVAGSRFTNYGAGLILRLNDSFCRYDLSNERGLGFYVKGSSTLIVSVATTETHDSAVCGTKCDDHYNKTYTLTNTWTHYSLAFSSLKQTGWGTPVSFIPGDAQYLQFSFGPNVSFELYLDEVGFY